MSASYLLKTGLTASTATSYTVSMWVKFTKTSFPSGTPYLWSCGANGSGAQGLYMNNSMILSYYGHTSYGSGALSDGSLRDLSGWYHFVWSVNSGTGTFYLNGVQQSASISNVAPLNAHGGTEMAVHTYCGGLYSTYDDIGALMSHVHFIDGTAYDASAFGETDANGVWKIKTSPSVTYGNNGFFILKDGNSVTDQSGNGNNFTASGTLTNTEDCPSNVFCVLNPLSHLKGWTTTDGNTTFNSGTVTDWSSAVAGTIGASTGKYYWEVKFTSGDAYSILGVLPLDQYWRCNKGSTTENVYNYAQNIQFDTSGSGSLRNYVSSNTTFPQVSLNDIFSFAMDMDNRKCWIGVNGVWYNSGNPATGTNPTWDTTEFNSDWDGGFVPFTQGYYISNSTEFKFNFGNGYFGTTAVASAGTNASGIGIFEYDVPTGYTALSTKGLNL